MRWRRIASGGFAVLLGLALSCGAISNEELACEQAVSRLTDCCPGLDARRLPCVASEGGSCSGKADPILTQRASTCVLSATCDELTTRGSCRAVVEQSYVPHSVKDLELLEREVCR